MYKGKFEIAWGAHAHDVTKTYKISYKVIDAVKNYNDCSEFYWQFISTESEIPANYIEGIIHLPNTVQNIEDLRVWAHGPLNGNIEKISNDTVKFTVEDFDENTMLEARVVTPNNVFSGNLNKLNQNKLNSILAQEQTWADEANAKRERIQKNRRLIKTAIILGLIITNIIGIIVAIVVIKKILKYRRELRENEIIKPEQKLDYYRDIPDETETPAGAGFLYYFKSTGLQYNMSKIISATMLDLCIKKYLTFEMVESKKNQIKVTLLKDNGELLTKDEKIVYDILQKIPKKEDKAFTMKEFEKYASSHSSTILTAFSKIENEAKKMQEEKGNYDEKLINKYKDWSLKAVGYIFLSIISIPLMQILIIPAIIASVYCFKIASRYNRLTKKGINEKEKWVALKKYMEDFSLIKDKEVPELILWEKYLVYATAFGIANKVLKQLKVVYPQLLDTEYLNTHGYTYMYLMYGNNFETSFINTLNNSVSTSYHSATNYSSGTGGGRRFF